jgi:N-carbamoyl-L-amino-acid hydrolase
LRSDPPSLTTTAAGHDAAVFANAGIPSAMIFIRNEHGSHNPREDMAIADFMGVAVMRDVLAEAAS